MGVSTTVKVAAASAVAAFGTILINPAQVGATAMYDVSKGSVELIPRCISADGQAVWEANNKNVDVVTVSWTNLDTSVSSTFVATAGVSTFTTDYEAGVNNQTQFSYDTTDGTVKDEVSRNVNEALCDEPEQPVEEEPAHEEEHPVTPPKHDDGKGHGHHGHGHGHNGHGPKHGNHGPKHDYNDDCEDDEYETPVEETPTEEQPGSGAGTVVTPVMKTEEVKVVKTETPEVKELANTGDRSNVAIIIASALALTAAVVGLPLRRRNQA